MLDKQTTIDRIEVLPESGHIQIRQKIAIIEDGTQINYSYHRYVLEPHADLKCQPEEVKAVATAAWANIPKPKPVIDQKDTAAAEQQD